MSQAKEIAELRQAVELLMQVVATGTKPGATPSAAAAKVEAKEFPPITWSIYTQGKAPLISVEPGGRFFSIGAGGVRTIDHFIENPKEWEKAKAAYYKACK